MVNRKDIKEATYNFVKAIAVKAKGKLGPAIKIIQRSSWMVETGAGSSHSEIFEREIFNGMAVDMMYQLEMRNDFKEKEELREVIIKAGFKPSEIEYGLLMMLERAWIDLTNPLDLKGEDVTRIISEFVDTIIEKMVITKSRYALTSMDVKSEEILLDEEVILRKILEEELWEFGRIGSELSPANSMSIGMLEPLSDKWMILEICGKHSLDESNNANLIKDAVLIDMLMSSSGGFRVIDLGLKQNAWFHSFSVVGNQKVVSMCGSGKGRYKINEEVRNKMVELWPDIISIFKTDNYLKMPAERLLEGSKRSDLIDAVIDYAIDMEALLNQHSHHNH